MKIVRWQDRAAAILRFDQAAGSGVQTSNKSHEFTGVVRWLVPLTTSAPPPAWASVREQQEAVAEELASLLIPCRRLALV